MPVPIPTLPHKLDRIAQIFFGAIENVNSQLAKAPDLKPLTWLLMWDKDDKVLPFDLVQAKMSEKTVVITSLAACYYQILKKEQSNTILIASIAKSVSTRLIEKEFGIQPKDMTDYIEKNVKTKMLNEVDPRIVEDTLHLNLFSKEHGPFLLVLPIEKSDVGQVFVRVPLKISPTAAIASESSNIHSLYEKILLDVNRFSETIDPGGDLKTGDLLSIFCEMLKKTPINHQDHSFAVGIAKSMVEN